MIKREKPKNRGKKGLVILIIGLFVVVSLGLYQIYFDYLLEQKTLNTSQTIDFYIASGENLDSVAKRLKKDSLISSEYIFLSYVKKEGLDQKIQAGFHSVKTGLSIPAIVEGLLVSQEKQTKLTILEGWRVDEIIDYLSKQGIPKEELDKCLTDCSFENSFITKKIKDSRYEGYLFPDTYQVNPEPSAKEIIQKMLDNYEKKINIVSSTEIEGTDEFKSFVNSHNDYEHMIVASMIEREVRGDEDRRKVSGIIWKRLFLNMGLGIDATVLYTLGDWDAVLTYKELGMDSPYNTRKFAGLPPTPICQPSLSSIKASYNPIETNYLYYLTPDSGEVIYSESLEEHNRNKRNYLQ